jgi:peptidoglycan/xylan/chitin deacetylase (PgdA/CDA1 family)
MTWTELAECVQKGVTIGSQTVTHRPVTELKPAEFLKEMADSQRELRARLSQPIYYFAYPDGKHNFAVESIASKYYDLAFAETQVPITPKSNRYAVPRYVHTQWRKAWADLMR